ncbi:uncharacterized protein LOC132903874 [Amyelois transitella]|uniref:uncharacterized protein LOC132903874 n=1 Tax=Amyelois transitella TaxID=680683 RepID=UPI0029903CBB|nr:uncharacterized protein LOC132903874 [Amyelois transitella]
MSHSKIEEIFCAACRTHLSAVHNFLKCCSCKDSYHIECLNIKKDQYLEFTTDLLSTWKCPSCNNVTRRAGSNLNTPVRTTQIPHNDSYLDSMDVSFSGRDSRAACPPKPVTEDGFESFSRALFCKMSEWQGEINGSVSSLRGELKSSLSEIRNEIMSLRAEQHKINNHVSLLTQDISHLKSSVEFCSNEHEDIKKRLADVSGRCVDMNPAVLGLEHKVDLLEQQARQCNLEICNVPERRNEHLPGMIEAMSSSLNIPIPASEIVSIHRVPHVRSDSSKPKNIIVKFTTRTLRDNVLSAYRKAKGLTSSKMGVPGTSVKIYLNEHLTLKKKHLFRLCRDAAKKNGFKYAWVKNSSILVRERDDSPAFVIRTESDLEKIVSNT